MVEVTRGVMPSKSALRTISDAALNEIIANTQANQASLTKLYNTLVDERVRRGLKLPQRRFVDDDKTPQF